jgi:hypothetical protein
MGSSASAPGGAGDLGATDIDPSKAPHPSKSRAPGSGLPKEIVLIIAQSNLLSLGNLLTMAIGSCVNTAAAMLSRLGINSIHFDFR